MDKKKKVLFFCEGWGTGGIESIVLSMVRSRAFQEREYDFDIFCACDWDTSLDQEVRKAGGSRRVVLPGSRQSIWKKYRVVPNAFHNYLKSTRYDIAHINVTNRLACLYARIAKSAGVPTVIVHSHNSGFDEANTYSLAKRAANKFGTTFIGSADARIACSEEAGYFLFGDLPTEIVRNGIEASRFKFDPVSRAAVREVLGFEDGTILVGSIGRIDHRKNPLFQLDVFAAMRQQAPGTRFLMVGDGEMLDEVLAHAEELNVSEHLIVVPPIDKPEWYYSALDLLLFPSLEEGFGLSALEAQCAGLPVLASTAVHSSVDATDLITHIDLGAPLLEWADCGFKMLRKAGGRETSDSWKLVQDSFGSEKMTQQILDIWDTAAGKTAECRCGTDE